MLLSFNDDIQGTGAVAAASVHAACRISGCAFRDSQIVIYGAGAAGLGIARQLRGQLQDAGLHGVDLTRAIVALDSRGVVSTDRPGLDDFKKELAWPAEMVAELELAEDEHASLAKVVSAYKATLRWRSRARRSKMVSRGSHKSISSSQRSRKIAGSRNTRKSSLRICEPGRLAGVR
jgi:malic enzyme